MMESLWRKGLSLVKERMNKSEVIYKCIECEYKSIRRFNVARHYERIHFRERVRECCDIMFHTKGDYYLHCAKMHSKNWRSITFIRKYGIGMKSSVKPKQIKQRIDHQESFCIERRYDTRQSLQSINRYKSSISFHKETTFTKFNLEDTPLINFLHNPSLIKCFKTRSSETKIVNTDESKENETEILRSSCKQSKILVQKTLEDHVKPGIEISDLRMQDNIESTCLSCTTKLPLKKLILNRFTTSKRDESRKPLQAIGNNEYLINKTTKTKMLKNIKMSNFPIFRTNKENTLKMEFEIKQKVKIEIDKNIPLPLMTHLHREFLSSIDFDNV